MEVVPCEARGLGYRERKGVSGRGSVFESLTERLGTVAARASISHAWFDGIQV